MHKNLVKTNKSPSSINAIFQIASSALGVGFVLSVNNPSILSTISARLPQLSLNNYTLVRELLKSKKKETNHIKI